jgi:hypothetical protein
MGFRSTVGLNPTGLRQSLHSRVRVSGNGLPMLRGIIASKSIIICSAVS